MQCKVIRPFRWNGNVRMPGQIVEMDVAQTGRLRSMGLVGQVDPERATKPPSERPGPKKPDRAVKKPPERRGHKRKAEPEPITVNPASVQVDEGEEDVTNIGDAAGD